MKVLLLYTHDSSSMGHQNERRLIGVFTGETEQECKQKVEEKYKKEFGAVIAGWCSYEIQESE